MKTSTVPHLVSAIMPSQCCPVPPASSSCSQDLVYTECRQLTTRRGRLVILPPLPPLLGSTSPSIDPPDMLVWRPETSARSDASHSEAVARSDLDSHSPPLLHVLAHLSRKIKSSVGKIRMFFFPRLTTSGPAHMVTSARACWNTS